MKQGNTMFRLRGTHPEESTITMLGELIFHLILSLLFHLTSTYLCSCPWCDIHWSLLLPLSRLPLSPRMLSWELDRHTKKEGGGIGAQLRNNARVSRLVPCRRVTNVSGLNAFLAELRLLAVVDFDR